MLRRPTDYIGFQPYVTNEDAIGFYIEKYPQFSGTLEIIRTGGGVLVRPKQEAGDGESRRRDTSDGDSADTGGGLRVADRAGTGGVTE